MTAVAELVVGDDPAAWEAIGFRVDNGAVVIGHVRVRFDAAAGPGVASWAVAGAPDEDVTDVDGLVTRHVDADLLEPGVHPNGAVAIDHVVVMTPDVDRTVRAVERGLGAPLRRTRDGDADGRAVRQAFFRLGEVILEVVGPPAGGDEAVAGGGRGVGDGEGGDEAVAGGGTVVAGEAVAGDAPGSEAGDGAGAGSSTAAARFWGLAVTVAAIDATCEGLGPDLVSPPKGAVQSGRRIATVRSAAGLGVPLAFMSADARR